MIYISLKTSQIDSTEDACAFYNQRFGWINCTACYLTFILKTAEDAYKFVGLYFPMWRNNNFRAAKHLNYFDFRSSNNI